MPMAERLTQGCGLSALPWAKEWRPVGAVAKTGEGESAASAVPANREPQIPAADWQTV